MAFTSVQVRQKARELGADAVGIASAAVLNEFFGLSVEPDTISLSTMPAELPISRSVSGSVCHVADNIRTIALEIFLPGRYGVALGPR